MTQPDRSFVASYEAFAERCATWSARVAVLALVLICILVVAEVFARNVLHSSTMIADEMCGYLNVMVVFFGLSYTMQRHGFIRVELLYSKFGKTTKHLVDWSNVVLSLGYILVVLYYMAAYAIYSYQNKLVSAELTQTPLVVPQTLLVVGALLLAIYLFKFVVNRCRDVP
jgi:TRAP-type C4-dicarboxylate transport system permease small subunit